MKRSILLFTVLFAVVIAGCNKDDDTGSTDGHDHDHDHNHDHSTGSSTPIDRIVIHQPTTLDKSIDDTMDIHVDFTNSQSHVIHHVQVRIYNKDNGTEVYNKPDDKHVHEEDGSYTWNDDFVLSTANGISANSTWVLETKVWGHNGMDDQVVSTVEFTVQN